MIGDSWLDFGNEKEKKINCILPPGQGMDGRYTEACRVGMVEFQL